VLQRSPLFRPDYRTAWSKYDVKAANALLDSLGLTQRDKTGLRLLPDGRPMEIVVDTSGESTEETDVLELVRDSWRKLGIALFSRPSQREVFRKRVYSGKSMMTVWSGLNNGIPTSEMSPNELAPTAQEQLQWPMWGSVTRTIARGGEAPALARRRISPWISRRVAWRPRPRSASGSDADARIHAQQVHDRHRDPGSAADRRAGQAP
jgi:peptide/nickel transport system substrate-binding protein